MCGGINREGKVGEQEGEDEKQLCDHQKKQDYGKWGGKKIKNWKKVASRSKA